MRSWNRGGVDMHNVRLDQIEETKGAAAHDPSAARLDVMLNGEWRTHDALSQFGGVVKFPRGEVLFEADFPSFLGGEGRAPTPLAYCFYGAMCCYGATFATQAAMAGIHLQSLRIALSLTVDFHAALGLGDIPPLSPFEFHVEVETDASDEDVQLVKKLADERCPAIWAMQNPVAYATTARKV
jgi:uncharacterized OsmC-like protein